MALRGAQVVGPSGSQGPSGITLYNSGGALPTAKIWMGEATVNGSGNWSVDYTNVGFTGTPTVIVTPKSVTNGAVIIPGNVSATTTGASGAVQGLSIILGLLTLGLSSINGSILNVRAIGN